MITQRLEQTKANARIKYFPDDEGNWVAKSITAFSRPTFVADGEILSQKWDSDIFDELELEADDTSANSIENQRKSYGRAKNNLFDILMATPQFDTFTTLTLDGKRIDRQNYDVVIDKLGEWLDNRVRRNDLTYVLVPEFHSDGKSIHFHGLTTWDSLKTVRAINQNPDSRYFGQPLVDNEHREVFNIIDYPYGYSTAIRITGENAREACAKYCFKYITKTDGLKVGGRYYLSGGDLGRPKYELLNVSLDELPCEQHETTYTTFKRMNFDDVHSMPEKLRRYYHAECRV